MKKDIKRCLSIIITLTFFCNLALSDVNINIERPNITLGPFYQEIKSVKSYQKIYIEQIPLVYTIATKVLQRQKPQNQPQMTKEQLYQKYQGQFIESTNCQQNDPQMQLKVKDTKKIAYHDSYIKQYFFDHPRKIAYILTNKQIQIYSSDNSIINLIGTTKIPSKFQNNQQISFFEAQNVVFITNGLYIYQISIKNQLEINPSIATVQWGTLFYNQQKIRTKINFRKCFYKAGYLFILTDTFYAVFSIHIKEKSIQQIIPSHSRIQLSKYLASNGTFVDIMWNPSKLDRIFILTDKNGIIQIKGIMRSNGNFQMQHHEIGNIGICQKFQKFNNVFEIIFKTSQKGQSYVAEFLHKQYIESSQNKTKSSLTLNRFYEKIHPVKDIQYFNGNIFILGQDEFQIYGPAVNRYFYQINDFKEVPYSGYNYDINWLQVIQNNASLYKLEAIGFGDQQLILWEVNKIPRNISCQFSQNTDIWLKYYGSNFKDIFEPTLMKQAVQYNYFYHLRIKDQYSLRTALLITGSVIFFLFLVALILCYLNIWQFDDIVKSVRKWQQKFDAIKKKKQNPDGTFTTLENIQRAQQEKSQNLEIKAKQIVQIKQIEEN